MGIENLFEWYQKKIGTYDKQTWETKLEQRERSIYGLTHIQTRSTKPNTDLIDLDLVRGSSFTKAKPKHGFIKVAKLATLRCILFPYYGKWWIIQTSGYIFAISLFVYLSQFVNIVIYVTYTLLINAGSESLSCMEIIVPFIMMWVLSLIHSQIVATSPGPEPKKTRVKHRQYRKRRSITKKKHTSEECVGILKSKQEISPGKNEKDSFSHSELLDSSYKRLLIDLEENVETVQDNFNRSGNHTVEEKDNVAKAADVETVKSITEKPNITSNEILDSKKYVEERDNQLKFCSTDSESETESIFKPNKKAPLAMRRYGVYVPTINITSTLDSTNDTEDEMLSSPEARHSCPLLDVTSSATEWIGVTTNSEDCSYSSDIENISDHGNDCSVYDNDLAPTAILNPPSVKVSCIIWERNEIKKADLSMLDISSAIIGKVDLMPESMDYFYIGVTISTFLAFVPIACRICNTSVDMNMSKSQFSVDEIYKNITRMLSSTGADYSLLHIYQNFIKEVLLRAPGYIHLTLGGNIWEYSIMGISLLQRWILACMIFFLLSVAERTFKQRLLYAKLFSHLTSSRRARKSEIPHFRLNKVRNIKTWLSVRSYLKKRGPQRSVDVIVSTAFIANLLLLTFLCVEVLKDTVIFSQYYVEALIWCLGLGILLLRFMTLGTKINKKYRNLSVLITEQINLHLQIEQKPHKKDEFTVANNVLKLAIDLLKELENPFKISGLSANPILYNVTKLVILSALSGVLSEMLGFKLKLHKIKLK